MNTPDLASPLPMVPLSITVLSLFPGMFPGPLAEGLVGQALGRGVWTLRTLDIRSFAPDPHGSVDAPCFGGGPGMLLRADVVGRACDGALEGLVAPRLLSFTPRGTPLRLEHLQTWAQEKRPLVLLCGRYEGVDQRVVDHYGFEEISLGDFVLMGGELPAMVVIEGCVRLLEGVLGNQGSTSVESFAHGLLEYPQYTRPRVWQDREVPGVLLSGNHSAIEKWRQEASEKITQLRRPDLWTLKQSRSIQKKY